MTRLFLLLATILTVFPLAAEPARVDETEGVDVIQQYQEALRRQQATVKNVSMDVTMEASIPKLKKFGRLNALRHISNFGKITYKVLGFSGDNTVKKEVMARYMSAEVEAAQNLSKQGNLSITPENYKFKFKGENDRLNRRVYVFELKPRHKRVGLFKGELWIDPVTYLPVRETGRLVKNPSIFIKRMEFTRDYDIRDGVAWLVHMESRTDTRIVGKAELEINYSNFAQNPQEAEAETADSDEAVEEARNR